MELCEIKIVDLNHSKFDPKKSNPDEGEYEFIEKKYVDYLDKGRRPKFWFTSCRYDPINNYKEFREWKYTRRATFLKKEDGYWPETMAPDAEGKYIYGDAVFVKIPLEVKLKEIEDNRRLSPTGKSYLERFNSEMEAQGVSVPDSMLNELMGKSKPRTV